MGLWAGYVQLEREGEGWGWAEDSCKVEEMRGSQRLGILSSQKSFILYLLEKCFKGAGGWGDGSASKVLKFDPRTHLEKPDPVTLRTSEVERGRS